MKKLLVLILVVVSLFCKAQTDTSIHYTVILYITTPITLEIPDLVINNTILKRKAICIRMTFEQSIKQVSVRWGVRYYADTLGSYGKELSNTFDPYEIEAVADNKTFVDPATGVIEDNPTGNVMGQYDWFFMIASMHPIVVNEMIRQYGMSVQNWNKK